MAAHPEQESPALPGVGPAGGIYAKLKRRSSGLTFGSSSITRTSTRETPNFSGRGSSSRTSSPGPSRHAAALPGAYSSRPEAVLPLVLTSFSTGVRPSPGVST